MPETDSKPQETARVGFLAQENIAVPPPIPGASVSRVVYELARELAGAYDVTVCSLSHPTVPEGIHEGVRYLRVPTGLDRRRHRAYSEAIRILRRLDLPHRELQGMKGYSRLYGLEGLSRLAEHDPDIVHLQNVSQFLPLARRLVPNAGLVLHMHAPWLVELPRRVVRAHLGHASLVLGVSEFIIDPVRNAFPDFAERCYCLYNGVDVEAFPPRSALPKEVCAAAEALRAGWGALDGPVIVYVGAMAPIKGTHVLLDAFSLLREHIRTATLVLVGAQGRYFQVVSPKGRRRRREHRLMQKNYPSDVNAHADRLGARIVFAGRVPHNELVAYYAAADVVTMPSTGPEAFPLPILESFASEVPVVASAVGGLPEIVQDGVNGRLVPAGDAEALAEALRELCESDPLRNRFGTAGRRLVVERFTWGAQARRLAALYNGLAGGPAERTVE
jgi:glycosyltransferase involved in cell wall biosynthesis